MRATKRERYEAALRLKPNALDACTGKPWGEAHIWYEGVPQSAPAKPLGSYRTAVLSPFGKVPDMGPGWVYVETNVPALVGPCPHCEDGCEACEGTGNLEIEPCVEVIYRELFAYEVQWLPWGDEVWRRVKFSSFSEYADDAALAILGPLYGDPHLWPLWDVIEDGWEGEE